MSALLITKKYQLHYFSANLKILSHLRVHTTLSWFSYLTYSQYSLFCLLWDFPWLSILSLNYLPSLTHTHIHTPSLSLSLSSLVIMMTMMMMMITTSVGKGLMKEIILYPGNVNLYDLFRKQKSWPNPLYRILKK